MHTHPGRQSACGCVSVAPMSARGPLRGHDTLYKTAGITTTRHAHDHQQHFMRLRSAAGRTNFRGTASSAARGAQNFHARTSAGERAAVPSCAVLARERLRARGRLLVRCHSGCCRIRDVLLLASACAPANTNTNTNTKYTCDTQVKHLVSPRAHAG
jgi:hypothetical protein